MRKQRRWQNKTTNYAAAAFADVTASNTLILNTFNKNHVIEVFVSRAFTKEVWQFEAQKPLENDSEKGSKNWATFNELCV